MAKNTHGGARKNAGRKPLSEDEKKVGISFTAYTTNGAIKNKGKDYIKNRGKVAAQKEIDKIK
jgi:hypothetical protein